MFRLRNAFFASCSSSSSAHVAVDIFASGKHRESGVHGKMTFLLTTEYVKIRLQLQILCQCYFVNDIHSRPPCLNSNLEETLRMLTKFVSIGSYSPEVRTFGTLITSTKV